MTSPVTAPVREPRRYEHVAQRLPFAAWLTFVWMALWGEFTLANLVGGVLISTLLLVVFPGVGPRPGATFRPLQALKFFGYFLVKLVEANAVVAWEVLTPNNESVHEGIVAVPVTGASDAVITLLANAISLTPGTLTLEVHDDPPMLFVHVLHLRSIEQTRAEVHRLEGLALAAFGDEAALRAHEEAAP
jgi:multicomponent Na+:H+ antiporter subunit E